MPVLGDVADAGLAALAWSTSRLMSCVAELDGARDVGVTHARSGLDELGLAVALDAGDAEHLAAVDVEADVGRARCGRRRRSSVEVVARSSSTSSVTVDSSVLGEGSSRADHQLGELARGDVGRA